MNDLLRLIREDVRTNSGWRQSQIVLVWFRVCQHLDRSIPTSVPLIHRLLLWIYTRATSRRYGVEIPLTLSLGRRLAIFHAQSIVINPHAVIGDDVTIRHGLTIGHGRRGLDIPVVGDGVDIGAAVTILGDVTIGDRAKIGAGAIVVHDVPEGATAVSPYAIILRRDASVPNDD